MAPIGYDDLRKVDNEQIDLEHREWVDIFNKLEKGVLGGKTVGSDRFQIEILKEILEFTRNHFRNEEELMTRYSYSGVVKHRRMHKEFDAKVYGMYREILDGGLILNSEILAMLRNWFLTHTSTEDRKTFQEIAQSMSGEGKRDKD